MSAVERRPRIIHDTFTDEHLVVLTLDVDEAEGVAMALGWNDAAGRELAEMADEIRRLDSTGQES